VLPMPCDTSRFYVPQSSFSQKMPI
jgi:hypothetical protein